MIFITVSGKPVPKGRPRFARRGNFVATYTPEATETYENRIAGEAQKVMLKRAPITCALRLQVEAHLPIPASMSQKKRQQALAHKIFPSTRPDADNYLKIAMDALNKIVYADDNQIIDARVFKFYSDRPRMDIWVLGASPSDRESIA